eukprot:4047217-Pyramimonas_sp.AAC.1
MGARESCPDARNQDARRPSRRPLGAEGSYHHLSKNLAEYEQLFGPSSGIRPSSGVWILWTGAAAYSLSTAVTNSP